MQRLINTGLLTLLAATALSGAGCKRAARDDSAVSAPKAVETTQQPSQAVVEGAQQQQAAQTGAGSYVEPTAENRFSWVKPGAWNSAPSAPANEATSEPANPPASEPTTASSDHWPAATSNDSPASATDVTATDEPRETTEPSTEVTRAVANTAMLTVVKDAMTKSVSKSEIIVTSGDDKSFHMVRAKLSPDTKITRDGEAASIKDIQPGDHVTVTYKMDHSQPVATKVEINGANK
jgi:hypothetical protein